MKGVLSRTALTLLLEGFVAAHTPQSSLRIDQLRTGADRVTVLAGLAENYVLAKISSGSEDPEVWSWREKSPPGAVGSSGILGFSNGKFISYTQRLGEYKEEEHGLAKRMFAEIYGATEPRTDKLGALIGQREATAQITVRDEHLPNADNELLFIEIPRRQLELRLTIHGSSVELDKITGFQ